MKRGLAKSLVILVGIVCVLPFLTACGPQVINVTESQDFQMTLSANSANAGEITFHVTNTASDVIHEFVIVKTDLTIDQIPLDSEGNVDEDQFEPVDEVEDINPGESKDLKVTLEPGHYILICNLPAHFTQGMRAEFTVK